MCVTDSSIDPTLLSKPPYPDTTSSQSRKPNSSQTGIATPSINHVNSSANGEAGWEVVRHVDRDPDAEHEGVQAANLTENSHQNEPIAVVGLALRFPQDATSPRTFWDMLMEKRSAMTTVPSDRFNANAFYHLGEKRTGVVRQLPSCSVIILRSIADLVSSSTSKAAIS